MRKKWSRLASALAALTVLIATDPQSAGREGDSVAAAAATAYWKPHLLLTSAKRYTKLHVEIDAVEGAAPAAEEIDALKDFLEGACEKPGGIAVATDDTIAKAEAKEQPARRLGLRYLDGPPDEDSAFLYFLFFDSSISPDKESAPFCTLSPYPGAIFVDVSYLRKWERRQSGFQRSAILHEAGHALGLCRRPGHSDGLHCTNKNCIMAPKLKLSISRLILGREALQQTELCADCKNDLAANREAEPPRELRYTARHFIRSEEGYHVVTQPNLLFVHVGRLDELDQGNLRELRAEAIEKTKEPGDITYSASAMDAATAARIAPLLKKDPVNAVRSIGARLEMQLQQAEPGE